MDRSPPTKINGFDAHLRELRTAAREPLRADRCGSAKAVALIAHEGKKAELRQFAARFREHLEDVRIVATSTTGAMLQDEGLTVERVASGPHGGDAQIAARVVEGSIGSVIFFLDPTVSHPHQADISALLRLCDLHDVLLATNPATAELVVRSLPGAEEAPAAGRRGPRLASTGS